MKASKEFHAKTPDELRVRLQELKKELFKAATTAGVGSPNPGKRRQIRKHIARALTIINQKESSAQKSTAQKESTKKKITGKEQGKKQEVSKQ